MCRRAFVRIAKSNFWLCFAVDLEPGWSYNEVAGYMNRALVLACGNPHRGDDGAALFLARYLQAGFCDPQTEILSLPHLTPDLIDKMSKADLVIIICASASLFPGEVQLEPIVPAGKRSHAKTSDPVSPSELLALSQQVYLRVPDEVYLLSIGGESFGQAEQLSEPVRLAIPAALTQIKALLSGVSLPNQSVLSKTASF